MGNIQLNNCPQHVAEPHRPELLYRAPCNWQYAVDITWRTKNILLFIHIERMVLIIYAYL